MDVTFKIADLDLHTALSTYLVRWEVKYQKVIITLDDVEHPFKAPNRAILEVSFLPMDDDFATSLFEALDSTKQSITFTDPYSRSDIVRTMRVVSDLEAAFGLKSVNGKRYYKGGKIELRAL